MTFSVPTIRQTFLLISLGCAGLMLVGFYMQYIMGLAPCPLCITQRIFIVLVGLIALGAGCHNPQGWGHRAYAIGGILAAVLGGAVSSRQLWLQSLPEDQVPACGPSLEYLLENFPLGEALELLFRGDGNCAEVAWSFLGISIPGWTLVAFTGLVVFNIWQLLRRPYKEV